MSMWPEAMQVFFFSGAGTHFNSRLTGYFHIFQDTNALGIKITDRTCLIMDEVDGMSAGDRGGVGALNAMIKKTKVGVDH